jgi:hypothetical protein
MIREEKVLEGYGYYRREGRIIEKDRSNYVRIMLRN